MAKLRLKYPVFARADKNGEYPDSVAKRLVAAGLAEYATANAVTAQSNRKGK